MAARRAALVLLGICTLALPVVAAAQDAATTPPATTPGGVPRIPAAPTREGAWLARVQYGTTVWSEPTRDSRPLGKVSATTPWGGPAQLLVLDFRYVGTERWALVRLPGRPNSNEGWITDAHIKLIETAWRIEVSRARRELRVLKAGRLMRLVPVVVGAPGTPTPVGTFAIADRLRQPNPNRFSGSWVLPLTAHSNVLRHFDGGDGQVALHGRGGASLRDPVGSARSHGCIRLSNASIAWIAARVPTGTPVVVR